MLFCVHIMFFIKECETGDLDVIYKDTLMANELVAYLMLSG